MSPRPRRESAQRGSVLGEIADGLSYVRSQPWLWVTFASAAIAYLLFIGPTEVLVPFVVKNELACTDPAEVKKLFDQIEADVKPQIQPHYVTECPRGHKGKWIDLRTNAEVAVDPAALRLPSFVAIPARDRIVPPASARPLAALIPAAVAHTPGAGHIGMAAGSTAEAMLWRPLRDWVVRL